MNEDTLNDFFNSIREMQIISEDATYLLRGTKPDTELQKRLYRIRALADNETIRLSRFQAYIRTLEE